MLNMYKKRLLGQVVEFKHPKLFMDRTLNDNMHVTWIGLANFELYLEIIGFEVLS